MRNPLPTRRIFGLDFVAAATVSDVADALVDEIGDDSTRWRCLVTPNVDHLVRYEKRPAERAVALSAEIVLPDGMPIVWASRLLGCGLEARLTGSDLFSVLWPRLAERSTPTLVVAPTSAVAEALRAQHAGATCIVAPMLTVSDDEQVIRFAEDVSSTARTCGAEFLIICLSVDKCHLLAQRFSDIHAARPGRFPYVMLLGASAQFHLDMTRRAPRWMQRTGTEWLHRLSGDPRRLAKRYLVDDSRFARLFFDEWRARRAARRAPSTGAR